MSCPHGNPIGGCDTCDEVDAAFEAGKRSALAEQPAQQEPVECKTLCELCVKRGYHFCANAAQTTPIPPPPASKPWVGLTDEQMAVLNFMLGADELDGVWFGERHPQEKGAFWWRNRLRNAFQDAAIEAKLREKNA